MMNSVLSLFDDRVKFAFAVYDDRRGKSEDHQHEKILSFYPAHAAVGMQVTIVGLAQALTSFAGSFGQEKPCHTVDAEQTVWVCIHCEPHISMLLVASKTWCGKGSTAGLEALLWNAHALFVLVHGTINNLLQQDAGGHVACLRLQAFMQDLAGHVTRPDSRLRLGSAGPLIMLPACPILPITGRSLLGVQSLVNSLFTSSVHGSRAVQGATVTQDNQMLWSTLPRSDTLPLYQLAVNALLPSLTPLAQHLARRKEGEPNPLDADDGPSPEPPLVCGSRWLMDAHGLLSLDTPANELLGRQRLRPGYAGPVIQAPRVWLQGGQEAALLLPYRHEELLVLLLLHESVQLTKEVVQSLLAVLQPKCKALLEAMRQAPGPSSAWHMPGASYLFLDHLCQGYRASSRAPTAAPTTPLVVLTDANLFPDHPDSSNPTGGRDSEVVWKLAGDGMWAVVRKSGARELRMVLEQPRGSSGLATVGDAVQKFCDGALPGMFEM